MSRSGDPFTALKQARASLGRTRSSEPQVLPAESYTAWGRAAAEPLLYLGGLGGTVVMAFPFQVVAVVTTLALLLGSPLLLMAAGVYVATVAAFVRERGVDPWRTFRHPFRTGLWVSATLPISALGALGVHTVAAVVALVGLCGMHLLARPKRAAPPLARLPITYAETADVEEWPEERVLALVNRWHEVCVVTGLVDKVDRPQAVMSPREARRYMEDEDYKRYVDSRDKYEVLTGTADTAKHDLVSAAIEAVHVTRLGPKLHVRLRPGWTPDQYGKAADALAHSYELLRVQAHDGGPGYVDVQLVGSDPLRLSPGPLDVSQFRSTLPVTTPWLVGEDEVGDLVTIDLASSAHMMVAGATRSGKSVSTYSLICHLLRMGDSVRCLVADPNDTTIAPFEHKVAWSTNSVDAANVTEMLQWVRREMDRRKPVLRHMRQDKFEPTNFGPEMPLIVVIIDEAANYLRHLNGKPMREELLAVVSQGAKYGIRLVLITQRPDSTILDTATRAQLSARICFRVEDRQTATMVFPDLDDPDELLTLPPGVGFVREVGGKARKFRGEYLADHWRAADVVPTRQPSIDIAAEGLEAAPECDLYRRALPEPRLVDPADPTGGLLAELLADEPPQPPGLAAGAERISSLVAAGELTQGTLDQLGDLTTAELSAMSTVEIGSLPGHGPAKVKRIQAALARRGLALRGESA